MELNKMAKSTPKYCKNCKKETQQEWQIDKEIPEEPGFSLICLNCGAEEEQ
jgi:hypothetical protein